MSDVGHGLEGLPSQGLPEKATMIFRNHANGWIAKVVALTALLLSACAAREVPAPRSAPSPSKPLAMLAFNPFVVSDPGGRVYVSFFGGPRGQRTGLYFTRSLDGGLTWLPELVMIEMAQPLKRRIGFHRLESDGKGNVYLIWSIEYERAQGRWRTAEVKRRHSHDYGATWSESPIVWTAKGLINYPTPRTGVDGELHMLWTIEESDNTGVFFNRTVQDGKTWWPSPRRVDVARREPSDQEPGGVRQPRSPAWPSIAHDAEGRIFVAWDDKRGDWTHIYFNRSLDQGATWSDHEVRLDHPPPRPSISTMPTIQTDGRGAVYVAWEDSRNGRTDIYLNRSLDMGNTWLAQDVQLNAGRPKRGHAQGPQISSDAMGRVYVLWKELSDTSSGLFFTASSDRGDTWFLRPRELVSRGEEFIVEAPRLGQGGDGHVYAAWAEYTRTKQAIAFSRSSDQGDSWLSRPRLLNDDATRQSARLPRMSADGTGTIYVVWSSDKHDALQLFLNKSTDHGETWLPQEAQITR